MRIAVVHNLMSGGAKRALFEQVRRLVVLHEVDVFSLATASHEFCDLRPHVASHRVVGYEPGSLFSSPFGLLNDAVRVRDIARLKGPYRTIAEQIDAGQYDVALIHPDLYTSAPWVLSYLRTPTVYYCHDPLRLVYDPPIQRPYNVLHGMRAVALRVNPLRPWYRGMLKRVDLRNTRAATVVLVNSCFTRETIYRLYDVPAHVCYLGVDTALFTPENQPRSDYVLAVGSVNSIKGFDFIIESLGRMPTQHRPPLLIVGNFAVAAERDYLVDLAQRYDVQVTFKVLVSDAEMVALYRQARATLCAPVLEPFGFVPLESMACGTPVIGVAEGGIRETIVHRKTGLLVDRVPDQFAAALMGLLQNPPLIEEMGQRGPSHVRLHWNWNESVARLEEHLLTAAKCQPGMRHPGDSK